VKAKRAARLCKADLLTEVVGEFPELQGLMGKYYAEAQGEDEAVAHACEDHYKPKGPDDLVPSDPISIAVALADKIDTLVGFWAIDEKPTGSKDPYALRRAALGVIRIIIDNSLQIPLDSTDWSKLGGIPSELPIVENLLDGMFNRWRQSLKINFADEDEVASWRSERVASLLAFLADRLKVQLREQGALHDLVDAVFALEGQDDLLLIVRRVDALAGFLNTDDGKNLLEAYRRATKILGIEEKRDGKKYEGPPDPILYQLPEERQLAVAIGNMRKIAETAVGDENFNGAMAAISQLRPRVDAFFDKVTVNVDDDKPLRENRLKLLNEIRAATRAVADFSKIEG